MKTISGDPTRSKVARDEYARRLVSRLISTKNEIIKQLAEATAVDDELIEELKNITSKIVDKELIEYYTRLFYKRGQQYADKQLRKLGIRLEITPIIRYASKVKAAVETNIDIYDVEITDEIVLNQLRSMQLDLVTGLSDDIKKKLAFELRDGLMKGEGIPKLQNRIRQVFEVSKSRAEMIARTESIRVFNTSAVRRYEQAGIRKWRWVTALDERTCSICFPLNGRVYRIGEAPPPAHPRCRCTVVPVIKEEREILPEVSEITGDPELDKEINSALNEFDKILKEEGSYVRALNRFVHGERLDVEEAQGRGIRILKKYFGKGGPEEVRNYIQNVFPFRINEDIIDQAGKVGLRTASFRRYAGTYDSIKRVIRISKHYDYKSNTFMHEYGHHLEHTLYLEKSRKFFLARIRKENFKLELLNRHKKYEHLGYDIYHFEGFDHVDPYMGRVYLGKYEDEHRRRMRKLLENPKSIEFDDELKDNFTTELVSVGLEHFTREETMKALYEKDREVFGFILSLLR